MNIERTGWHWVHPREYFRKWILWISEGLFAWFVVPALSVVILLFFVVQPFGIQPNERSIRIFGMLLQIAGFFLTVLGINSTSINLGLRSIPRRTFSYLSRAPILPIQKATIACATVAISGKASMKAVVQVSTAGMELSERISYLESEQHRMQEILLDMSGTISKLENDTTKKFAKFSSAHDEKILNVTEHYDNMLGSSAQQEIFGVVLFFIGVILATASPEISAYFL